MYKFVLFAFVAVCAAQVPYDTPEVAAAKAAHLAALAEAQARSLATPVFAQSLVPAPVFPQNPVFTPSPVFPQTQGAPAWRVWDGVPAPIVVQNGNVQDTAEVAAEKAKHFAFVADAAVRSSAPGPFDDGKYRHETSGEYFPFAHAPASVFPISGFPTSGFPAHGFPAPGFPAHGFPAPGFPAPGFPASLVNPTVPLPYQYTQTPVVVSNGNVQDTAEVAALKAARLAELRAAGAAI